MEQPKKNQKPASAKKNKGFFSDEVTKKKIDRHLSDMDDTISDEDIRNVITDINSDNLNNINDNDTKNLEDDSNPADEKSKEMPSSWNIID